MVQSIEERTGMKPARSFATSMAPTFEKSSWNESIDSVLTRFKARNMIRCIMDPKKRKQSDEARKIRTGEFALKHISPWQGKEKQEIAFIVEIITNLNFGISQGL